MWELYNLRLGCAGKKVGLPAMRGLQTIEYTRGFTQSAPKIAAAGSPIIKKELFIIVNWVSY